MSGFTCQICAKSKDETEHNFLSEKAKLDVCDSCMKTINEKILKRTPLEKERQEVEDLFGGSME